MKAILSSYRLLAFSLVLLILTGVPLKAQTKGVLWGEVADTASGAPVAGATVKVQLESDTTFVRYTYTNAVGKYRFGNLQVGKYRVTYSMLGYSPVVTEAQVGDADPTMMRIVLAEEPLRSQDIVVTASRHEEKATHAPASISSVSAMEIQSHINSTPTEALAGVPGMDVSHEGLAMSTYASRSMHSVFGSDILTMNDYHSMEVPSIGGFYGILMPQISDDIDHIEVVRGPGSALYGPEAATGVVHIISKSPFASQGTNISIAGGLRGSVGTQAQSYSGPVSSSFPIQTFSSGNYFDGSFRHAQAFGDNFAIKVSGHYLKADDWHLAPDTNETKARDTAQAILSSPARSSALSADQRDSMNRIGNRNFGLETYSFELRADAILADDATLVLTGGLTNIGNDVAMTEDFGGAQIKNWLYDFGQARLNYKDLFVQFAINHNNTSGSYFLPTGRPIVNRSSTYVAQIQHQYAPMDNERLTYGADYQAIRPISDSTIYGPDDGHANVSIYGLYLQSQTELLDDKLDVVLAGRMDKHSYSNLGNTIPPIFSPRAAAVYHLNDEHLVRAMYNETYLFPTENGMYADIFYKGDPFGFAQKGLTQAPYNFTPVNIWYVSPYVSGLKFVPNADGSYTLNSTVLAPFGQAKAGTTFHTSADLWKALMQAAAAKSGNSLLLQVPAPPTGYKYTYLSYLNLNTGAFDPAVAAPEDISDVKPQHQRTLELDYQGSLNKSLQFEVDAYQTHYTSIKASTQSLTPNEFVDSAATQQYLTQIFAAAGLPAAQADGAAQQVAGGLAGTPYGVVQASNGTYSTTQANDILVGTRHYLENAVEFYGVDAIMDYKASDVWNFSAGASWLNKNYWYKGELNPKDSSNQAPFALNMPKYRASLTARYSGLSRGVSVELRDRWSDAFQMDDSYWIGNVAARHVLDLTVNYRPEHWNNLVLTLSMMNVLDNEHQEFAGAPIIGRLTVLRAAYTLPNM